MIDYSDPQNEGPFVTVTLVCDVCGDESEDDYDARDYYNGEEIEEYIPHEENEFSEVECAGAHRGKIEYDFTFADDHL